VPYQEKFYLKKDIKIFKNDFYWEMIFIFATLILFFVIYRISKGKVKNFKDFFIPVINVTFYILFFAFIFQKIIISIVLFTNRIIDTNQTQIIYKVECNKVQNYTQIINKTKSETITNLYEEDFFNRLEDLRVKKKLKSIIKSDTIHIKYENGLFGIKYLNE
jgi:hypothetical protein